MDDWLDLNPNPCGDKNLVTKKKKTKQTNPNRQDVTKKMWSFKQISLTLISYFECFQHK